MESGELEASCAKALQAEVSINKPSTSAETEIEESEEENRFECENCEQTFLLESELSLHLNTCRIIDIREPAVITLHPSPFSQPVTRIIPIVTETIDEPKETFNFVQNSSQKRQPRNSDSISDSAYQYVERVEENGETVFKCSICQKCFVHSIFNARRHIETVHFTPTQHECHICHKIFKRSDEVFRHMAAVHFNANDHTCELCGKMFSRKDHLRRHLRNIHQLVF